MKKTIVAGIVFIVLGFPSVQTAAHAAAGDIGSVVALRGNAAIERDAKVFEAKLKEGIQLRDSVETKDRSKVKMLFVDDSVLTVGEKTRVAIKEFVYSKDERGRSIFNLLEGKMRSVVGRSEFEVRTPTLVAAARGTVFDCETGQTGGKALTTCTSYEGIVDIRSIDPTITGKVMLQPGMTITVISGQPLPAPTMAPTSAAQGGAVAGAGGPSLPLVQGPSINLIPPTKGITPIPPPAPTGSIKVGW
jgi:hypothetical protein